MSVESLSGLITGGIGAVAVLGIFFALLLTGKLHTDQEMERADDSYDRLAAALDLEKRAHEQTRQALTAAAARADAAVRASELIAGALGGAGAGSKGGTQT
jgi:hypothetical protein